MHKAGNMRYATAGLPNDCVPIGWIVTIAVGAARGKTPRLRDELTKTLVPPKIS